MQFYRFKSKEVFGKAQHGKYHSPESLVKDPSGHPYICASNANNGVNKSMPRVRAADGGGELSLTPGRIIAWGKQCPKFCFHTEPCVTSQGMYYLDMKGRPDTVCLYTCGALARACGDRYGYSSCLIGKVLDEVEVSLPVKESGDPNHTYTPEDIDWEYMDAYMERILVSMDKTLTALMKVAKGGGDGLT